MMIGLIVGSLIAIGVLYGVIWCAYWIVWERGYFAGRDLENKLWRGNLVVSGLAHWEVDQKTGEADWAMGPPKILDNQEPT